MCQNHGVAYLGKDECKKMVKKQLVSFDRKGFTMAGSVSRRSI